LEKEHLKEQERLKKEEQKEQERLKREEEAAKKAEEKRKKEEERVKKEEERLKKEEEKKKALEEKEKERLRLEEKKAKQAQHFTKFFQKSPATNKPRTLTVGGVRPTPDVESDKENKDKTDNSNSNGENSAPSDSTNCTIDKAEKSEGNDGDLKVVFIKKAEASLFCPMPFEIKSNMAVAPLVRRDALSPMEKNTVDKCLKTSTEKVSEVEFSKEPSDTDGRSDFLERCRRKQSRKTGRTRLDLEVDVRVIIQDVIEPCIELKRFRKKLLHFHDNRRPAYWGTWKKPNKVVSGRRPFVKEKVLWPCSALLQSVLVMSR
jgi:chromatin assembly factor 1 subunit A